jgi:beta-N-acetylhexosaminidase
MVDSHKALPVVGEDRAVLEKTDFAPFRSLRDAPWVMTAHVIYSAYDDRRLATLSPVVISEVIRGFIGCDGMVMSDDLSMHALAGSFKDRDAESLRAGCDFVLHCNGDMDEMRGVAEGLRPLDDAGQRRFAAAEKMKRAVPLMVDAQNMVDGWLKESEA